MGKKIIRLDGSNQEALREFEEDFKKLNISDEDYWKKSDEELFGKDEAEESGHTNFRDCGKE